MWSFLEKKEYDKYDNINFTDTESVKVSPFNDEISGVPELEDGEESPIAIDNAIKKSKGKKEKGEKETELSKYVDFYENENKKHIPSILEIDSIINQHECEKYGNLRFRGKFSNIITKKMHFS